MFDRLVELLIQFADLFRFWKILDPYEQGVLIRLGKFVRIVEPGLSWIYPFGVDSVMHESVVPTTHSLGNESIITKDGKGVGYHAVVTYRIRDIKKAMLEISDTDHAVRDACSGEVGRVFREHNWCDIIGSEAFLDELTSACRKRGWRYGIEIMSIQLAGLALVKSIRLMQN
jgi:regulator of protease activity HflC (stomatin/prohibitin superfamily)